MAVTGIDVSRHQGAVDFAAVKRAGHSFAILKATDGVSYRYIDWFRTHFPKAKAAGLVPGAYHFLLDHYDGASQARYFVAEVNRVGGFRGVIAVLDVEKEADGTYPKLLQVQQFVAEFRRLVPGHPLVIYTGGWFWNGFLGDPPGAGFGPLWHSEYEGTAAEVADGPEGDDYGGWPGCTIWQWTSSGTCPGVAGSCDMNILRRGTLADLTNSPQEDIDMPVTNAEILKIAEAVWQVPIKATDGKTAGPAAAHLRWANYNGGRAVTMLAALSAEVAALRSTVAQLGAGGSVDYARVQAAAHAAVEEAFAGAFPGTAVAPS